MKLINRPDVLDYIFLALITYLGLWQIVDDIKASYKRYKLNKERDARLAEYTNE